MNKFTFPCPISSITSHYMHFFVVPYFPYMLHEQIPFPCHCEQLTQSWASQTQRESELHSPATTGEKAMAKYRLGTQERSIVFFFTYTQQLVIFEENPY